MDLTLLLFSLFCLMTVFLAADFLAMAIGVWTSGVGFLGFFMRLAGKETTTYDGCKAGGEECTA